MNHSASNGVTPLLLAARHEDSSVVDQLLAAGAKTAAKDYNLQNSLNDLDFAAGEEQVAVVVGKSSG
jgi:ankyrin repeat protein